MNTLKNLIKTLLNSMPLWMFWLLCMLVSPIVLGLALVTPYFLIALPYRFIMMLLVG